jgi:hypothetical protein
MSDSNFNIISRSNEIGWILILIGGLGVNEYIIKKFVDNELILVCYFSIIFLIGFYLLNNNFKNKYLKNLKMKED